jgi:hypothetical protein
MKIKLLFINKIGKLKSLFIYLNYLLLKYKDIMVMSIQIIRAC